MRSRLVLLCVLLAACRGHEPTAPALTIAALGIVPPTAAGATAGDSIRVRVADVDGNLKAGVSVAFAVTAGGGSVSPGVVTTDAQGRAAARFTTGTTVGVNTATATIAGAAPAAITLTTIAGPATTLSVRERIVFVDAGQRFTPTVTAVDANGNAVSPSQLLYEAQTPFVVSVASDGSVSGAGLAQTFLVVSSPLARDSVLVVVTMPNGPVLRSEFSRFDLARDTTFTVPIVLDMRTAQEKLGATTVVIRWDPTQFTFVSNADGSSAAGALVNTNAVAQGSFTLALANASGLAGRIELQRLTFKATTTTGKTGTLRLSVSEISAAGTFANLLSKTAAVTYPLSIR